VRQRIVLWSITSSRSFGSRGHLHPIETVRQYVAADEPARPSVEAIRTIRAMHALRAVLSSDYCGY
jgi:hypothetical protein